MSEEFIWTEDLAKEFASRFWRNNRKVGSVEAEAEDFKKSKTPKKEWEVLIWKHGNGEPHPHIGKDSGWLPCELLGCKPYSVHRLSDNEVFTVGDVVGAKHKAGVKILSFNIFEWKMMVECENDYCDLYWLTKFVQLPKKERIEVYAIKRVNEKYDLKDPDYVFAVSEPIPKEKLLYVKAAIERVLNDEGVDCRVSEATLRAIREAEERGFNAGRLTHPLVGLKFDTFQDYLKSKENEQNNLY